MTGNFTLQFVDNGLSAFNPSLYDTYHWPVGHEVSAGRLEPQVGAFPEHADDLFPGFDLEIPQAAMKVKEIDLTAHLAWSPPSQSPILLALGTAAEQLDATFNTSSTLEVHSLNLNESGHQMPKVSSLAVEHRYHKLIWGQAGIAEGARPNGILVGGLDQGIVTLYDAQKLLKGQHEGTIIASKQKHSGPVQALDFNSFQSNLLASGASESEIYIWDVNKLSTPMTPGAKTQPLDDVRCVAWNKQVQHILATTFASRCVVWDLRKNDPIIKVSDSTSRMKTKVVAWHPEVATQLCLASEDDHTPVIQIWDLRLASSPLRTLEGHQRGVLSVAWCQQDSDLLLSCGKDNRILCWNPNSNEPGGELLCELPTSNQWSFDVSWCPRNPGLIASSSFDGHVSIYSLMGGQQQTEPSKDISDSFPGMEAIKPIATPAAKVAVQLKKPPKWLRRPCGATFGFGGKIVTFDVPKMPANQQQQQAPSIVRIGRVVTEPQLIERSQKLETSLQNHNVPEFCESKIASSSSKEDKTMWQFIKASFDDNPRLQFLNLLGFNPELVTKEVEGSSGIKVPDVVASDLGQLDLNTTDDKNAVFEAIAARNDSSAEETASDKPVKLNVGDTTEGLLTKALLTGNLELAVEICLERGRMTDAIILASRGSTELLEKTQKRYFAKCASSAESHLIEAVVGGDWRKFVSLCSTDNWKEALVAALNYSSEEDFSRICSSLGDRLSERHEAAMVCYICAGDLDSLVGRWMTQKMVNTSGSKDLQDLVEVVMSLKSAIEQTYGEVAISSGPLATKLGQYASILASQGALSAALAYIGNSQEDSLTTLRDRLTGALGRRRASSSQPTQTGRLSALRKASRTVSQSSEDSLMTSTTTFAAPRRRSSGQQHHPPMVAPPSQATYQQQQIPTPYYDPTRADRFTSGPTSTSQPTPIAPDQGAAVHAPPVSSGPGWNDPPPMIMSRARKEGQGSKTMTAVPEPITQPLFGAPSAPLGADFGPPPSSMGPQTSFGMTASVPPPPSTNFGVPDQRSGYSGFSQANPMIPPSSSNWNAGFQNVSPAPFSPQVPQQSTFMTPVEMTSQPPVNADLPANMAVSHKTRNQVEPVKEKGPIPTEHQVLQDVFDGLRTKCVAAANHPQVRRKLEDVAKKLEILYDKLREETLSENTLTSLHQLASHLRTSDFGGGMIFYTSMVSGPSFAEIAAFMPALKVLIQLCQQHQVVY